MGIEKGIKLEDLDKELGKEGFERRDNNWFAATSDLAYIIKQLAYGRGYSEIRIISSYYLNREEERSIFNTELSRRTDRYLIYVKVFRK